METGTKGSLTVVDGVVTAMEAHVEGYGPAIVPNELLHQVLAKIGKFGWKPEGSLPMVFQQGRTYIIPVIKT